MKKAAPKAYAVMLVAVVFFNSMPLYATDLEVAEKLAAEMIEALKDGMNEEFSRAEQRKNLINFLNHYGDLELMARQSLGIAGRRAKKSQITAYSYKFRDYLVRKYMRTFAAFNGADYTLQKSRKTKSYVEVKTSMKNKYDNYLEVTFLFAERGGETRFFNVIINGLNLLLTERQEVSIYLDQREGNLDLLIQDFAMIR